MHGRYEGITKVNLLLTEPSQVSEVGPREGEQQATLHLCGSRGDCSRVSASHPETGTHCGAKQQRSPIPGRQPQQVASLHPRTAKVTCPVYKQITSRSSCLFEQCLEPRDVSKTGLCISQRPFHFNKPDVQAFLSGVQGRSLWRGVGCPHLFPSSCRRRRHKKLAHGVC